MGAGRSLRWCGLVGLLLFAPLAEAAQAVPARPNILVILADDLGYADLGFQGCKDIPTPNLDGLARSGVRCTSGYVSHPFCSPTRAGLITGRYQQRFGHENNPQWNPDDTISGLPLAQATLPAALKSAGYTTGCVGKWHLGAHPQFHPNRRGFDEYFGMLGGGHVYLPEANGSAEYQIPMDRNGASEPLKGYLTTVLGQEGAAFVTRHQGHPWFLYLAFNAPHAPLQVTEKQLDRVKAIEDETRRRYAGLVVGMDDAVGEVLAALRASGQDESTLVFFMSDNGGPTSVTHSDNSPLRGAKGQTYEGGVRVPYVVSWPGHIPEGKDFDSPVFSLDVFATAAAIAGVRDSDKPALDGVNILPWLSGEAVPPPDRLLFWRASGGDQFAVREGKWKLVGTKADGVQLFDLETDLGEAKDLAAAQPQVFERLKAAYDAWNKDNIAPIFKSPPGAKPKAAKKAAKK
jgi:arylsulfatase A-like enzyme